MRAKGSTIFAAVARSGGWPEAATDAKKHKTSCLCWTKHIFLLTVRAKTLSEPIRALIQAAANNLGGTCETQSCWKSYRARCQSARQSRKALRHYRAPPKARQLRRQKQPVRQAMERNFLSRAMSFHQSERIRFPFMPSRWRLSLSKSLWRRFRHRRSISPAISRSRPPNRRKFSPSQSQKPSPQKSKRVLGPRRRQLRLSLHQRRLFPSLQFSRLFRLKLFSARNPLPRPWKVSPRGLRRFRRAWSCLPI